MQNQKTMATIVAILLVTSMAISLNSLSTATAYNLDTQTAIDQGMNWTGQTNDASASRILLWTRFHDRIPTWSFLIAAPNPVGVGQSFNLVMYNPQVPPGASLTNDIRYTFSLEVVKPNGDVEKLPPSGTSKGSIAEGGIIGGKYVSDSTGSTFAAYTPDQTGNYTITVFTDELFYRWNSTSTERGYYGTTFLASNYTLTVTVQDEPSHLIGLPDIQSMPTEYWTRPIEGQNDQWYQISSNWLCSSHDKDNGGTENRYQPDGIAPNSPHILWTRPTEDNGILGGTNDGRVGEGNAFNAGSQYQPRFNTQIIMYGRLYYTPNTIYRGTSELLDCVDLKTGELLWEVNTTEATGSSNVPSFGYYYSDDNPNEHGIANPGWLFTRNYAIGYQPERGFPYLSVSNVPNGFEIQGPAGEYLRYVLTNKGNNTNPAYYLSQWNSSNAIPSRNPTSNTIDAGRESCYDWNVSFPIQFDSAPTVRAAVLDDILFGSNGSWPTGTSGPNYAYPDEVTLWAVSLKPGSIGQLLYMKNIDVDDESTNQNIMFERATGAEGVCVAIKVPSCSFIGYSIYTGDKLWETDAQSDWNAYGYFTWPSLISQTQTKMAYGLLYTAGYTGAVSAYNLTNGNLEWRQVYPSGGAKIQNYVQMIGLIADGKIFVGTHEHSADTPLYKGEQVHALNATTGETVWDMASWAYPMTFATADGVLIYWNNYDAQVYAIGKGPSQMTIEAPNVAAPFGTPVVIRGTVTDISAGTQQNEQAARFPNGVPAVSDESMNHFMEYVYMQKGKPTNTTGVPVSIDVIDNNGNYRNIGSTVSDANGVYSLTWTPDIEGSYTVIATFAGSESYWPSIAESTFAVASPTATASPYPEVQLPATEMYFVGSTEAIIIAIAIVGILMLRDRP